MEEPIERQGRCVADSALNILVENEGAEMVLRIEGQLDLATVASLRACIDSVDPGIPVLAIDMGEVTFLDSTGLGLLATTHHTLVAEGRQLVIRGARGQTRELFDITGLDRLLPVSD